MQEYRERQRELMEQAAAVDKARLRLDYIRNLCIMQASNFMMKKNLKFNELQKLANMKETADPLWARTAYNQSTRPLSMDAVAWTHWDRAACPWTTWRASWNDEQMRPSLSLSRLSSRWKDRLLRRHQPKPFSRSARNPHATTHKRSVRKSHFFEHLPENQNYGRLELARHRHRNRMVLTTKSRGVKERMGTIAEKDDHAEERGDKRDTGREPKPRKKKRDALKYVLQNTLYSCLGYPPKKVKETSCLPSHSNTVTNPHISAEYQEN